MRPTASAMAVMALLCAAASTSGCRGTPADLREWRPSDHSREVGEGQGGGADMAPMAPEDGDPMVAALAIYRSQCANCHGEHGRGDGPQAAMLHPPDWSAPAFQQSHTDEQLAASITRGKNTMPAFGQTIRPEGITLLVRLVRQFGAQQAQ